MVCPEGIEPSETVFSVFLGSSSEVSVFYVLLESSDSSPGFSLGSFPEQESDGTLGP